MRTVSSKQRRPTMAIVALCTIVLVLATASTHQDALAGHAAPSASVQVRVPKQAQGDKEGAQSQTSPNEPDMLVNSSFNYQGLLQQSGNPANGPYDFQFKLFDASSGGTQVGSTITMLNQTVSNGLFVVQPDFGATAYQGQGRWVEIAVRAAGGGSYTTLTPRQAISTVPYAASLMPGAVITGTSGLLMSAISNGSATGLYGQSSSGQGVHGISASGSGVYGETSNSTPAGVFGRSLATSGNGVIGEAMSGSFAIGVWGRSTDGMGIYGTSTNGRGVVGTSTGNSGVYGTSSGEPGVYGTSTNDSGVYGESSSIFVGTAGVSGKSLATFGTGVRGEANVGSVATGVYGTSNAGTGVAGSSATNNGVSGTTGGGATVAGVRGISTGASGNGVWGTANNGTSAWGVYGDSDNGWGVYGQSDSNWGVKGRGTSGVWGEASAANGYGVHGSTTGGWGVYGAATTGIGVYGEGIGYAGYFLGNVEVVGGCCAASMGTYKIDHPADPENKYLVHSAVESPDMKTIYDGNATLDGKGEAVVVLPDYIEALNRDFRYQFAPIGSSMPGLYIAEKVRNNRFKIGGGKPGGEVSWQVTGIRKDPYAKAHPIQAEVEKPADEKGKYRHPTEHGQPESKGINYEKRLEMKQVDFNKGQQGSALSK